MSCSPTARAARRGSTRSPSRTSWRRAIASSAPRRSRARCTRSQRLARSSRRARPIRGLHAPERHQHGRRRDLGCDRGRPRQLLSREQRRAAHAKRRQGDSEYTAITMASEDVLSQGAGALNPIGALRFMREFAKAKRGGLDDDSARTRRLSRRRAARVESAAALGRSAPMGRSTAVGRPTSVGRSAAVGRHSCGVISPLGDSVVWDNQLLWGDSLVWSDTRARCEHCKRCALRRRDSNGATSVRIKSSGCYRGGRSEW